MSRCSMAIGPWVTDRTIVIVTTSTSNVTGEREAHTLCFRHNTTNGLGVCPAALHRILRAGAVRARRVNPTEGQPLRYATHRATTSSPASLASPRRPVPPSIMPSRTKPASRALLYQPPCWVVLWAGA